VAARFSAILVGFFWCDVDRQAGALTGSIFLSGLRPIAVFSLRFATLSTRRLSKEVAVDDGTFRGGPLCTGFSTFAHIHQPLLGTGCRQTNWIAIHCGALSLSLMGYYFRRTDDAGCDVSLSRSLLRYDGPESGPLILGWLVLVTGPLPTH